MCKDVLLAVALLFLLAPAPQSVAASDMSLRPKVRSGTPGTPLLCFAHSSPLLGAKERSSRHVHRMSTNPTASPDGNFQQKMAVGVATLLLLPSFAAGTRAHRTPQTNPRAPITQPDVDSAWQLLHHDSLTPATPEPLTLNPTP